MKKNNFLIASMIAAGAIFSSCSDKTVATTDQYPADETGATTGQTGTNAGVAGADTDADQTDAGYGTEQGVTREDVAATGQETEMDRMGATGMDASMAALPAATQQLVVPMQDMMQQMSGVEAAGVDEAFAKMMIIHHQGAINLANQVMQSGDNNEIKQRAQQLITTKQQEVERLQQFAGNTNGNANQQMGTSGTTGQQDAATGTTDMTTGTTGTTNAGTTGTTTADPMEQLRSATEGTMEQLQQEQLNGDADHDFAHILILHHQDAIEMANVELQHGQNQQVKEIAQKIVDNNKQQIAELQTWTQNNDQ